MKRQIRWSVFAALLLILSLTGCKRDLGAFEFSYSVESVDNFKVMLSMDSEKHYKVERIDYFMDNFARKRDPKVVEGVLTDDEYAELSQLIADVDFFSMKDSYGFESTPKNGMNDLVYQISLSSGGKEKFLSIRSADKQVFPQSFIELVKRITVFNDQKLK